jgi:hypothetical protein
MTYQDLIDFLENKMRLSHIYQPLLIKSLIESGGSATIRHWSFDNGVQHEFMES